MQVVFAAVCRFQNKLSLVVLQNCTLCSLFHLLNVGLKRATVQEVLTWRKSVALTQELLQVCFLFCFFFCY